MDQVILRFEPDGEWDGKLIAQVSAGSFCGQGAAWFSTAELRAFAASVSAYPLAEGSFPSIAGGFFQDSVLEQVHLGITFEPHGLRGAVRTTVRLATADWSGGEKGLACEVTARFLVTYPDLSRFGPAFLDLIDGRSAEAALQSSAH